MDDASMMPEFLRMIAALVFVLGLMGALLLLLKKLGLSGDMARIKTGKSKRLHIVETLPLDAKRRLVLLQRDDTQHLIIMSANGETLIESGIPAQDPTEEEHKP